MSVSVKRARIDDVPTLTKLLALQMEEHRISIPQSAITQAVELIIREPAKGAILVASVENAAVGTACVSFIWTIEHGGKSAWLEELYVLPEYRERRIGQQLLDAVTALVKNEGCHAIDLEVDREHSRVEGLYLRNGFQRHERSRWFRIVAP